jgi:hypothetical protein
MSGYLTQIARRDALGLTVYLPTQARLIAGRVSCPCEKPPPILSTRRRLFAVDFPETYKILKIC